MLPTSPHHQFQASTTKLRNDLFRKKGRDPLHEQCACGTSTSRLCGQAVRVNARSQRLVLTSGSPSLVKLVWSEPTTVLKHRHIFGNMVLTALFCDRERTTGLDSTRDSADNQGPGSTQLFRVLRPPLLFLSRAPAPGQGIVRGSQVLREPIGFSEQNWRLPPSPRNSTTENVFPFLDDVCTSLANGGRRAHGKFCADKHPSWIGTGLVSDGSLRGTGSGNQTCQPFWSGR